MLDTDCNGIKKHGKQNYNIFQTSNANCFVLSLNLYLLGEKKTFTLKILEEIFKKQVATIIKGKQLKQD